jgi:hypothetical protein
MGRRGRLDSQTDMSHRRTELPEKRHLTYFDRFRSRGRPIGLLLSEARPLWAFRCNVLRAEGDVAWRSRR